MSGLTIIAIAFLRSSEASTTTVGESGAAQASAREALASQDTTSGTLPLRQPSFGASSACEHFELPKLCMVSEVQLTISDEGVDIPRPALAGLECESADAGAAAEKSKADEEGQRQTAEDGMEN